MIRKYLVCGKQVFMASHKAEVEREGLYIVETLLPIRVFWKAQKLVEKSEYMIATGEDQSAITEVYLDLFRLIVPYSVMEKDRLWLYDKIQTKYAGFT